MKRLITGLLVCFSFSLSAQKNVAPPNSYSPSPMYIQLYIQKKKSPKLVKSESKSKSRSKSKVRKDINWELDQQILEFEKRMKSVAKKYKKESRLAKKPQYSDPSYFGHKHKPKKRSVKKRKFCKECRIVH